MIELTTPQMLFLALGAIVLGIVLLVKGGNYTIDGAVFIARKFNISPLVVGLTIVALGTSLPELIVSINANIKESPGIVIGNILGSNLANILLVIGTTASLVAIPAVSKGLRLDLAVMMLATVWMMASLIYGEISRLNGLIMVLALLAYVLWQYKMAAKGEIVKEDVEEPEFNNIPSAVLFLFLGLVFVAIGAEYLVRGSILTADIMGVPDAVIGLSIIAIGTSLPELSTCIMAAMKKQTDIVLGNIVGSNVFNILLILGFTAAIVPIETDNLAAQVIQFDIWVTAFISLAFTVIILWFKKITRAMGFLLVALYLTYLTGLYYFYMT